MSFAVYQQLPPTKLGEDEYLANLKRVETLQASSPEVAIDYARNLPIFRYARGLARYPIVATDG